MGLANRGGNGNFFPKWWNWEFCGGGIKRLVKDATICELWWDFDFFVRKWYYLEIFKPYHNIPSNFWTVVHYRANTDSL